MGEIKPLVAESAIRDLLSKTFEQEVGQLVPLEGGNIARVFTFRVGHHDEYVIRLGQSHVSNYEKERFVLENFGSAAIPIPPILKTGELDGLNYAISKKMPGKTLNVHTADEYFQTLPSNMATLLAIHQTDVGRFSGYGYLDSNGNGEHTAWADVLRSVIDEEAETSFYGKWHSLFETSFMERDFFESAYQHMLSLLPFCPEERYLLHGDYDYTNVLAENSTVTAVLDWEQVRYGDFVYDIAYLDFFRSQVDLATPFREFYAENGMDMTHFDKRFSCYTIWMGLGGMKFFAKTNSPEGYRMSREVVEKHLPRPHG